MGNDLCGGQIEENSTFRSINTTNPANSNRYSYPLQRRAQANLDQRPVGLQNLTNTCYISSVLQVLFLILPESMNSGRSRITDLFFKLKASKDPKIYKVFKSQVQKQIEIVKGCQQQDAQQFLIHFLDLLDQQNCQVYRKVKVNLDYNQRQSIQDNYKIFVGEISKIEKSPITSLFSAELIRQFRCPQYHIKHKFQRYQCLSLSFPPTASSFSSSKYLPSYSPYSQVEMSLQQLFKKEFQSGQQIINDLICQQCKQKTNFKKITCLYTLPNYLILHLARFKQVSQSNEKIDAIVEYKDILEVKAVSNKTPAKYKLMGTINHCGSMNRGHFYTHVRHKDGNWYEMNDQRVRLIRMGGQYKSQNVYILFFERLQ